jgi:hypothetical protein
MPARTPHFNSLTGLDVVVVLPDGVAITPTVKADIFTQINTQTGGTLTVNAPTGTAINGQRITFRIKFTNAQTWSFDGVYRGGTTALPTTSSSSSKTDYLEFIYNSTDTKWDLFVVSYNH